MLLKYFQHVGQVIIISFVLVIMLSKTVSKNVFEFEAKINYSNTKCFFSYSLLKFFRVTYFLSFYTYFYNLTTIGMSNKSKKNAHLQRHLGASFKIQSKKDKGGKSALPHVNWGQQLLYENNNDQSKKKDFTPLCICQKLKLEI